MSADTKPEQNDPAAAPLRREALLPNERSRGLGTVAVVCTMAGVASGLALATTLMAMQVADTMSVHNCPYRVISVPEVQPQHGFLGIRYVFHDGEAEIDSVLPNTPASALDLHPGDQVVSVDGTPIRSADELQSLIYDSHPGAQPTVVIRRGDELNTYQPTLAAWPVLSY